MPDSIIVTEAQNLAEYVAARADATPDTEAIVDAGGERPDAVQGPDAVQALSWAELERRVAATAAGLSAAGLVAGHRVVLALPNSIRYVVDYLACLRAGLVAVPIDPQTGETERAALAELTGARQVLTPDRPDQHVGDRTAVPPLDPDTLALLLRTAGTSAEAKVAMITHRSLMTPVRQLARLGLINSEDTVLAALPLWHVYGLNVVLGGWLGSGCRLIIADPASNLAKIIEANQVSVLPAVPAMLEGLLAEPDLTMRLRGVRTVLSAAAPLSDDLVDRFASFSGHKIESGYGLTEAAGGVTTTLGGGPRHGIGHVGRPMPGVEIRIGDGTDPAEPDRIWIRGEQLFSGYWPDGRNGPDQDGWYDTGDLGYLADGDLYLVERSRELIMVDGFSVYPAEVEMIIAERPGVIECAVIGDERGVIAYVVAEPGVDADAIAQHCADRLPRFKRPAAIQLIDALPRGVTGKVQKAVLRRLIGQAGSDSS